jgi:DNA-3-methyladenine glycosylase I
VIRCAWAGDLPAMVRYHDEEWGVPVHDDRLLFEFLTLEGAQAGLSWRTILDKRDGYRRLFAGFEPERVARFTLQQVEELLADPSIVRNRLKVESTITNAAAFLAVQEERGSFGTYLWEFVAHTPVQNGFAVPAEIPAETPLSRVISRDLKRRGFRFVGPTIVYAMMQAIGMVNDHTTDCFRWPQLSGR